MLLQALSACRETELLTVVNNLRHLTSAHRADRIMYGVAH